MSSTGLPAFVVLEIPPPVCGAIQAIRDSLSTPVARLPVEITVAGSSGIGPIPVGTDQRETEERLKAALEGFAPFQNRGTGGSPAADSTPGTRGVAPFRVRFQEVRRFANTDIFYLAPAEREPFDRIHEKLKASGIPFGQNPWPFNPHCTLRGGAMNERASAEEIFGIAFPKEEFLIETVSIYELDSQTVTGYLAFQMKLGG